MKHEFDLEQNNYDNSNYELDIWSSCFNPIFNPPPEVINEWHHCFDDDRMSLNLRLKTLLFISLRTV